jgi:hypothetical protein
MNKIPLYLIGMIVGGCLVGFNVRGIIDSASQPTPEIAATSTYCIQVTTSSIIDATASFTEGQLRISSVLWAKLYTGQLGRWTFNDASITVGGLGDSNKQYIISPIPNR